MATINRGAVCKVLLEGGGKLSIKEVALKMGLEESQIRSAINAVKTAYKGLKESCENEPGKVLDNGKVNTDYLQDVEAKYGVDLSKIKPRDTRGKPSLSIAQKMGLEDLEF